LGRGLIGKPLDGPQRVRRWYPLLQIDKRQHRHLGSALPSHSPLRPPNLGDSTLRPCVAGRARNALVTRISAPC
jgi:hypothetical protein